MAVRARIGVAVALWLATCAVAGAYGEVSVLPRAQTFVVQSMLPDGKALICAGVVVARDGETLTVATAAHALYGPVNALRILDESRLGYYDVLDVRVLREYDLAFVHVRAHANFPVAPVQFADAVPHELVEVWGHPGSAFWQSSTGVVTNPRHLIPGESGLPRAALQCDACGPGDAGAGVFDQQGRLVGILTSPRRSPDGQLLFLEVEPSALIAQEVHAERMISARAKPPGYW